MPTEASPSIVTALPHAALRARPDLAVLRVTGDDRVSWLNGQITNDIRQIPAGGSVQALAVTVRGKIIAEVWVAEQADALLLVVPRTAETELTASFERYIIMEDVTLAPLPAAEVLFLEGPGSEVLASELTSSAFGFSCDVLGLGGYAFIGNSAELTDIAARLEPKAHMVNNDAYELARVQLARPAFGSDFDANHYPQEAGLKDHVSFNKGCYLGQEVICTLESRGRLSRRLCALTAEPGVRLEHGTQLTLTTGESIGAVTSTAFDPVLGASRALGYVKRAHALAGTQLRAGEQALTIERVVGDEPTASLPA